MIYGSKICRLRWGNVVDRKKFKESLFGCVCRICLDVFVLYYILYIIFFFGNFYLEKCGVISDFGFDIFEIGIDISYLKSNFFVGI